MQNILICTYDKELIPERKTDYSVGWDIKIKEDVIINPQSVIKVSAWIKTSMPKWWQCQVFARSWLHKYWLMIANSVALFDADYRWEYLILLYNFTNEVVKLDKYTRIAQLDFQPYYIGAWQYWTLEIPWMEILVDEKVYDDFENIYPSWRWIGAFGSTGV